MGEVDASGGTLGSSPDAVKRRCLTVLYSGDQKLRGGVIPIGDRLCVGRNQEAGVELAIDDKLLSRRHATVQRIGTSEQFEIVDHDSRNGTFVDGVRTEKGRLALGSIIRLGVSVFELTSGDVVTGDEVEGLGTDRDAMVGRSAPFLLALARLREAAATEDPVVLFGESGAGKTMAAAFLHRMSGREGPLLVVNCGGTGPRLSEVDLVGGVDEENASRIDGYLESCERGTLLLDEIDLLDASLQPKLLEILERRTFRQIGSEEERPLTARVLGSTGVRLQMAIDAGAFDPRLADALGPFRVELPPLRERRCDIPLLVQHFLKLEEPKRSFDWSPTFLEKLVLYDWPGNVRELRTIMRRLTMIEEDIKTLRSAHLPREIRSIARMPSEDQLRASAIQIHAVPSRVELEEMLVRFRGDVQRIAEHYAKDRRHVYRWLHRHDLSASDFRG